MANFPTSISTDANLYIAVNGLQTTLATAINAVVTTITLTSTSGFPTTGAVTINNLEVVFYTGISGSDLTGCTRGADGTTAASHNAGVTVGATVVAAHHNFLKDEIIAVETALGTNLDNVVERAGDTMTGDLTMSDNHSVILKETTANGTDAVTLKAPASVTSSYSLQLPPAVASAGQVLTDVAGNGITSWQTPGTGITQLTGDVTAGPGAGSQVATLATVNGNVGSFTNSSITVNAKGLITAAASGTAPVTSVSGTTNQITSTGGATPVLALASPLTTPGSITVTDSISFSNTATGGITGTTTNDNAAAGKVGEYISAAQSGNSNLPATGVYDDLTSISLTAGDWDVSGDIGFEANGATGSQFRIALGINAGNDTTGTVFPDSEFGNVYTVLPVGVILGLFVVRFSFSTTTTVYLKRAGVYTAGSPRTNYAVVKARRVR